jgi:hypothetical protein
MASAKKRNVAKERPVEATRRFGSEDEASVFSGFSKRTLQRDRLLNRDRFPWYKVGGKILYDLAEIEVVIASTRRRGGRAGG